MERWKKGGMEGGTEGRRGGREGKGKKDTSLSM